MSQGQTLFCSLSLYPPLHVCLGVSSYIQDSIEALNRLKVLVSAFKYETIFFLFDQLFDFCQTWLHVLFAKLYSLG